MVEFMNEEIWNHVRKPCKKGKYLYTAENVVVGQAGPLKVGKDKDHQKNCGLATSIYVVNVYTYITSSSGLAPGN